MTKEVLNSLNRLLRNNIIIRGKYVKIRNECNPISKSLINIARIIKIIGIYIFFVKIWGAKIAVASIGVKLGGWGINLDIIKKNEKKKKL